MRDQRPLVFLALGLLLLLFRSGASLFPPPGDQQALNSNNQVYIWLAGSRVDEGLYSLPAAMTMAGLYQQFGMVLPADDQQQTGRDAPDFSSMFAGKESVPALYIEDRRRPAPLAAPARLMPFFYKPLPINRAAREELAMLNGIGFSLAERIIALREAKGGLRGPEDLAAVPGLGRSKISRLAGQLSFE